MSTHISVVPEGLEWKQAYLAAVLEKDRTRVVGLIHDARSKFATRSDELAAESYFARRNRSHPGCRLSASGSPEQLVVPERSKKLASEI
jgi:hypothetical protein